MGYHWLMPETWTIRLYRPAVVRGTIGGIMRDLRAFGFEVLAVETVEKDVVSVIGVHPFAGRVLFAGQASTGAIGGHVAAIHPYAGRKRVVASTQARKWVKSQKPQEVTDVTN